MGGKKYKHRVVVFLLFLYYYCYLVVHLIEWQQTKQNKTLLAVT